ncbi:MAG TPA: D-alanyl-D-alanine carboxypeptidase family protein [Blastocatellia bacterium]|nr:D-alanyl-D-alanine carboxypeptidase family protein [Blastocatellia bacterium]
MKSSKGLVIGVAIVLATVAAIFGFQWKAVGQSARIQTAQAANNESSAPASAVGVERLSAAAKPAAETASAAAGLFASAASRNADLQDSLTWAFGGKSQRGWRLYAPLVGGLIGADSAQTSGDFAAQLSRWQQQHGASANGILDNNTWSQMVSNWQANRLKDHSRPTAEEVVTIPTTECYDPSRPEALRQAERRTYAAYKQMIAAAASDPSLGLQVTGDGQLADSEKYFKVVSALRTPEYQAQLRAQSPNSGRAGLAVNSPHFTGRALDLYVGGEPVSTKDDNRAIQTQTKAYRWLVKNAGRFGFRPYFYEPWHWEYVGK